jgi:hypothetical protein
LDNKTLFNDLHILAKESGNQDALKYVKINKLVFCYDINNRFHFIEREFTTQVSDPESQYKFRKNI